jgi:hypothetical protein
MESPFVYSVQEHRECFKTKFFRKTVDLGKEFYTYECVVDEGRALPLVKVFVIAVSKLCRLILHAYKIQPRREIKETDPPKIVIYSNIE